MKSSIEAVCGVVAFLVAQCASATIIPFAAVLSGAAEAPPNASPGFGNAAFVVDTDLHTLSISAAFAGLIGTTTAAHIHCCTASAGTGTAGVATTTPSLTGFPLGVTAGNFGRTLDLLFASSYNPAFVAANGGTVPGAEAVLVAGMMAGATYFNIHTTFAPGGEIRGFLVPIVAAAVPEPWSVTLLGIGVAAALVRRRGRGGTTVGAGTA